MRILSPTFMMVAVVAVSALWVRLAPSHLSRSEYRHGSISIDGVYPYMPDEEIEKDLGPALKELALSGSGHTHLYARGGRRTVVEFDSQSWTALQISGHQLEKNGLVVLQIGDTQAKAQQVINGDRGRHSERLYLGRSSSGLPPGQSPPD